MLRKDGELNAQGNEENGIYRIYVDEVTSNRVAAVRPYQRLIMDWHKSLGHVSFDDILKLGDLLPNYRSTQTIECKTCLIGKSAKLPFKKNEITTTASL